LFFKLRPPGPETLQCWLYFFATSERLSFDFVKSTDMMSHAHAFDWRTTAAARDRRLNEGTQHAGGDENAAAATNRSSGATAAPGRGHTDLAAKKHDTKQLVVETPRQQPATAKQGAKTFALWIPEEQEFRKQVRPPTYMKRELSSLKH
jgi:hypothetical protein